MDAVKSLEIESSQEILATGKEIVGIFNSKQFKKSLKELYGRLEKLNEPFEAGFIVLMDPKTKDFSVLEETDMSINKIGLDKQGVEEFYKQLEKGKVPVVDFHFHPPTGDYHLINSFTPSMSDLEALHDMGLKSKPIGVIGIIKGNGNIDMIFFQEIKYQLGSPILRNQLEQDLLECHVIDEVLETLREYGYKAGFGSYNLKEGLLESSKTLIKSFSVPL